VNCKPYPNVKVKECRDGTDADLSVNLLRRVINVGYALHGRRPAFELPGSVRGVATPSVTNSDPRYMLPSRDTAKAVDNVRQLSFTQATSEVRNGEYRRVDYDHFG
jgi:hypothetical protein